MKPVLCVLCLFIFGLILFACTADDDDNNDSLPAADDDNDDTADDDADNDDDSQPIDVPHLALYGIYDDGFHYDLATLWIYYFNGLFWNTPVDTEHGYTASDIWGADAEHVFVVGHTQHLNRAMVYHFDGNQWRRQDLREPFGRFYVNYLSSVSGSSPINVYVLGYKVNAWYVDKGMIILHYDGQDWLASYTPDESVHLQDLWCAPDGEVFTVGYWYHAGSYAGYLVVHNGSGTWVETRSSDPNCALTAVWGAAADDVFVAGVCNVITGNYEYDTRVLVLHYNGDQWQEMDTAGLENLYLQDISGSSGQEVYLATNTDSYVPRPKVYFFDGYSWSEQQQINQAIKEHGNIRSIWATSSSELYIVNDQLDIYDHNTEVVRTMEGPYLNRVWAQASEQGE